MSLSQIEVVAETVVETRVQKTEETVDILTKNCRTLEEDLTAECENRLIVTLLLFKTSPSLL